MTADRQRQTGAVLLAAGILLVWLAWRWHGGGGLAVVQAAVAGPLSAALGLGLLIHGGRIPRYGLTRRTRAWGLIGGLAGGAYLALVGVSAGWPPVGARWLLVLFATGIWLIPVPPVAEAGGGASRDSTKPGPPD